MLRIPRSFELDGLFMALPQAMLDAMYEEHPKEAIAWAKQFAGNFVPSYPVTVEVPMELLANKDFYFDRKIVPFGEELQYKHKDFVHEQYGVSTSNIAIKLGEIFNKSPRKIDHALRGMFGGVGADVVGVFGRGGDLPGKVKRDKGKAGIPIIGKLFHPAGQAPFSPESTNDMFDRLEWANGNMASKKKHGSKETEEERQLRLMLKDATAAYMFVTDAMKLEVSRKERAELEVLRTQIAKEAVKAFDSRENLRPKFKAWKREAETLTK
jgi:hypothetical protein